MCGIVGLYLKSTALEAQIGELFTPMLIAMTDRGPDSAGFAIYGDEVPQGSVKLTLAHNSPDYSWAALAEKAQASLGVHVEFFQNANVAVFKLATSAEVAEDFFAQQDPDILVHSAGRSIEILKEVGLPQAIADTFNLKGMQGSHIIGHTRMATESSVSTEGSHPFTTGEDLCLVHNGAINVTLPDRSLPSCGNSWISDSKLAKMHENGTREIQGIGVKTGLEYFHKYEVDLLGAISRVRCEGDRLGLASRE